MDGGGHQLCRDGFLTASLYDCDCRKLAPERFSKSSVTIRTFDDRSTLLLEYPWQIVTVYFLVKHCKSVLNV